jgi:hypothetical protein
MGYFIAQSLKRRVVTKLVRNEIGNYQLGYIEDREFVVKYIGRSDNDLRAEIIQQGLTLKVDNNNDPIYTHFRFHHDAATDIDAFHYECEDYHEYGESEGLDNEIHPARPEETPQGLNCETCDGLD